MKIKQYHKEKASEIWDYEESYKPLIRYLKKHWYDQIVYDYPERGKNTIGYLASEMKDYNGAIRVYNIFKFCQLHFGNDNLSENNLVLIAYCLYKLHKKALTKKMDILLDERAFYNRDKVRVFREYVFRGFIPRDCLKNVNLKTDYYIQANVGALIYDKPFSSQQEADEFRSKWAVLASCGIICPKS